MHIVTELLFHSTLKRNQAVTPLASRFTQSTSRKTTPGRARHNKSGERHMEGSPKSKSALRQEEFQPIVLPQRGQGRLPNLHNHTYIRPATRILQFQYRNTCYTQSVQDSTTAFDVFEKQLRWPAVMGLWLAKKNLARPLGWADISLLCFPRARKLSFTEKTSCYDLELPSHPNKHALPQQKSQYSNGRPTPCEANTVWAK